jgi:muramoyltetrapeptide carboxypeptidase
LKTIKPPKLKRGDLIGIVAPASPVFPEDKLEQAAHFLEHIGYRVTFGKYVRHHYGYLAGDDVQRASDINSMFANKKVNAIFCLRGGYGTPRILNRIDYKLIQKNPKILVGFSDITALSCAITAMTGLITFSGPMLVSDMIHPSPFAQENLWRMLTSRYVFGEFYNHSDHYRIALKNGIAQGKLVGGNLSLLTALIGTPFLPDLKKSILFMEDIGEEPYRVDRMLSHFENAYHLQTIAGLAVAQFTDCEDEGDKPSLSIEEVITDYVTTLPKSAPVLANLSYGHIKHKLTLPIGAKAKLSVIKKQAKFELIETVVS